MPASLGQASRCGTKAQENERSRLRDRFSRAATSGAKVNRVTTLAAIMVIAVTGGRVTLLGNESEDFCGWPLPRFIPWSQETPVVVEEIGT